MNNLGIVLSYALFLMNSCGLAVEDVLNMVEIPEDASHPYAELPKDGTSDGLSTQFLSVEVVRKPLRKKKQTFDEKAQVTLSERVGSPPKISEHALEAVTILSSVDPSILPTPVVCSLTIEEDAPLPSVELPIMPIVEACTRTTEEVRAEKQLSTAPNASPPPKQNKNQPTVLDRALASTLQRMSISTGSMPYLFFQRSAFPILGLPEAILYQMMHHFTVTETKPVRLVCKQFALYGQVRFLESVPPLQTLKFIKTASLMVTKNEKVAHVQNRLSFLHEYLLVETRTKILDSICAFPSVKISEVCERILRASGGKKMFTTELFDCLSDLTMVPTPLWDKFFQMGDELYNHVMCLLKFAPSPFERAQIISFLWFVPTEFLPCIIQTTYQFYITNTLENQYRTKSLMVLTGGLLESQKKKMGDVFKSKRWSLTPNEIYSWALEWDNRFPDS